MTTFTLNGNELLGLKLDFDDLKMELYDEVEVFGGLHVIVNIIKKDGKTEVRLQNWYEHEEINRMYEDLDFGCGCC